MYPNQGYNTDGYNQNTYNQNYQQQGYQDDYASKIQNQFGGNAFFDYQPPKKQEVDNSLWSNGGSNNQNQYSQNQYAQNQGQGFNQNTYGNQDPYSNQNQYQTPDSYSNQNQFNNPDPYQNQNQFNNQNQSNIGGSTINQSTNNNWETENPYLSTPLKRNKFHKKKHTQDPSYYQNFCHNNNANMFGANYLYQYQDGYKKDKTDQINDFTNNNNNSSANNFAPITKDINQVLDLVQQFAGMNFNNGMANQMNDLLSQFKQQNLVINNNNLHFDPIMSGVFGNFVPAPLREEKNDIDGLVDPSQHLEVLNSYVKFKNERQQNCLDDLQQLLTNSNAIQKAKQQSYQTGKFTDADFPPTIDSIMGFREGRMKESDFIKYPWCRPEEYFKGAFTVYGQIAPEDIQQGQLGDCYFLASLSSISEFPERIERLILVKQVAQDSVYAIAMCHDGIWTEVVIDDTVACQPVSKSPIFTRSSQKELWVILMEKAWAKINGGFQNISAGLTREALRGFTGASCKTFFTQQNREEIWKKLMVGDKMNFIMTAATDDLNNGSDDYQDKIGICGSHAYSLLAVYEITNVNGLWQLVQPGSQPSGQVERLVKLRNPWGKCEWKGSWNDNDPKWNDQLKNTIGDIGNMDDGIFCMPYGDFVKYYSDVQICYYHDGYKYSAIKVQGPTGTTVYLKFSLNTPGVYYLSLNQKLTRAFPKSKKYRYSNLSFMVSKIGQNGNSEMIGNQMKDDLENWIEQDLQTGEYLVAIKLMWVSFVDECSFSVYGPGSCTISKTDLNAIPKNLIDNSLNARGEKDTQSQVFRFDKQGFPQISYKLIDEKNGFGFVFFSNKTGNVVLEGTADFSASQGITLQAPYSGTKPVFTVEPGKNLSIAYEASKFPYTVQLRLIVTFDEKTNRNQIVEAVRQSKAVIEKYDDSGNMLNIRTHMLHHSSGLAILYINEEPNVTLNEVVNFDLHNCHIDGTVGNILEVCVKPNTEKLIKIVVDDQNCEFMANVVGVSTEYLE